MKLRLITLTMNPDTGGFPSEPLADIEGEVMSTSEHFFVHGGLPQLLLIVHYREKTTGERVQRGKSPVKPTDPGVRAVLSDPEKAVFDRLRAWRTDEPTAKACPSTRVVTGRPLRFSSNNGKRTVSRRLAVMGWGEVWLLAPAGHCTDRCAVPATKAGDRGSG